ncbi:MAG: CDP-diacylglycerol--glycerol-3-phosphate 3-phosphatidyltransferase [Nitrospirota bacterium]
MKKHIPNILTVLRLVLTVVIIICFIVPFSGNFLWIFGFFVVAVLTDYFDGMLARRWKVESTFGKVFDSLIDKILVLSILMMLIPYNIVHYGIFVAFLFRDIFVDGLKNYLLSLNKPVAPKITGKLKFFFQTLMIGLMLLLLSDTRWDGEEVLYMLGILTTTSLALFFAYFSAFLYTRDFIRSYKS